jgi:uncharacterized membrane protein YccC
MRARPFPATRQEPRKRILLIPVGLILGGLSLTYLHRWLSTGFFGIIISLAGVISLFLVGMIFADLWASARLTKSLAKAKGTTGTEAGENMSVSDPFEDELETDK